MSLAKVVLHIGMGKCGSTAIKAYCRQHPAELAAAGIAYGGQFFEELGLRETLALPTYRDYMKLAQPARLELNASLHAAVESRMKKLGATTLFLSNENFCDNLDVLQPLLSRFAQPLHLVLFLRNPVDWVWSAYLQWGIKHKHYDGAVLGADDWIAANLQRVSYAQRLKQIRQVLPGAQLEVISYDDCGDVVARCLQEVGAPAATGATARVVYPTLPLTAHAVLKIVNNQQQGASVPWATMDLLARAGVAAREFVPTQIPIALPTRDTLARVVETAYADLSLLHQELDMASNPKFYDRARTIDAGSPADATTVIALLIEVITKLDARVLELERGRAPPPGASGLRARAGVLLARAWRKYANRNPTPP